MSGAARQRGRGRATGGDVSDTSSRPSFPGVPGRQPGAFDGPASRGSASGTGSQARRPSNPPSVGSRSAGGSPTMAQGGFAPQAQQSGPVGVDPALDLKNRPKLTDSLKNLDLPASFYNVNQTYNLPTEFKARPGFNTTGKAVQLALNSFPVTQVPTQVVYQYDVLIGNGAEKRGVIKKVWDSQVRVEKTGTQIIFDGNKLAWSGKSISEIRAMVDLDAESGRRPRAGPKAKDNSFRLGIKPAKKLDLSIIQAYLEGRVQMGVPILEAINFLDHMLREFPRTNPRFIPVKRSFFVRDSQRMVLGGGVEVFRGVYQSMRLAEGKRLVINLDVANTTFFQPQALTALIMTKYGLRDIQAIINGCRPAPNQAKGKNGEQRLSPLAKQIEKTFRKTLCTAIYPGNNAPDIAWNIEKIMTVNAKEEKMDWKKQDGTVEHLEVEKYFMKKYNVRLQYPQLPLVQMTKRKAKFPMELLTIREHQRYNFKLDEKQTANMIKFAVAPPEVRQKSINDGKGWLDWSKDPICQSFGLKVDDNYIKTNARLLPPPGVRFGNKTEQPGTKGRWDLRGKKFLTPNKDELVRWGVGIFTGRTNFQKPQIDKFCTDFARAYRDHGGRISNNPPHIMQLPADPGIAVESLYNATGNKFQDRPQLLVFLVQDKNSFHYLRIKKSCDCRYGVVSQVMQLQQVLKGNGQYYSNVLMKVNAKLGGSTSQSVPHKESGFKAFTCSTMIIGADVSHASPGSDQPSMAALTVSFDKIAARYVAGCQTNGVRVEMISKASFRSILGPLCTQWTSEVGGGQLPAHVMYIRDGVSEGQFASVMQEEVPCIRGLLSDVAKNAGLEAWKGQLTVIIAGKRHHIRAFPKKGDVAGDAKGNPVPGCLIERDVTTPFEFDFFLYSHIALQGTSRPVHYTVLHDEMNLAPNVLQNMLYEHCYQYMRSTTSVSLHPAVYYAHLASNRAKAHEDVPSSEGPQGGPGFKANVQPASSDSPDSEVRPLVPMFTRHGINFAMWYI